MTDDRIMNDDICLDRLVDGELTGEEYRRLLASLDDEPGGWRRCALAFLEAQAWGQEFRVLRHQAEAVPVIVERHSLSWTGRHITSLAISMAASFLCAFALGAWWYGDSTSGPTTSSPRVTSNEIGGDPEPVLADRMPPSVPSDNVGLPSERMTIVVDDGEGRSNQFEMPVYDWNDAYARRQIERYSALPPDVEREIRRSGYEVRSQRQWTPVDLQDGRRVVFPVDRLEITPVSGNVFQ